jgi:uncharacterized protein with PhoU and TrkA domain
VTGTVLSVRSDGAERSAEEPATEATATGPARTDAGGGEGRVTVAVRRTEATALLAADRPRVVVRARGERREFELVSLLRRTGRRFRRLTVAAEGVLAGTTLGGADVHRTHGVAVLAVRHEGRWTVAPAGETRLEPGDELFAVGRREALDRFGEAVA